LVGASVKVGRSQPTGADRRVGDCEVGQQSPSPAVDGLGEQDVCRLDVVMRHSLLMGVVKGVGYRGDDHAYFSGRHAIGELSFHQLPGVGAVDVIRRDPQPPIEFAVVVHTDDVGVNQH
jgi:hypothetical protein